MSIINIISNDELTLVQGVNGLFFCEESWVTQSMKRLISKSNCFSYRASRLQRAARFASEQNKLLFSFDALTSNPS